MSVGGKAFRLPGLQAQLVDVQPVSQNDALTHVPFFALSLAGKVHGSLARAGKVRGQTPKVAPQEKAKKPTGRACKRLKYNRRFVNVVTGFGKKRGPNSQ